MVPSLAYEPKFFPISSTPLIPDVGAFFGFNSYKNGSSYEVIAVAALLFADCWLLTVTYQKCGPPIPGLDLHLICVE